MPNSRLAWNISLHSITNTNRRRDLSSYQSAPDYPMIPCRCPVDVMIIIWYGCFNNAELPCPLPSCEMCSLRDEKLICDIQLDWLTYFALSALLHNVPRLLCFCLCPCMLKKTWRFLVSLEMCSTLFIALVCHFSPGKNKFGQEYLQINFT